MADAINSTTPCETLPDTDYPTMPGIDTAAIFASGELQPLCHMLRAVHWQACAMAHVRADEVQAPEWDVFDRTITVIASTVAASLSDLRAKVNAALYLLDETDDQYADEARSILDSLDADFAALHEKALDRWVASGDRDRRMELLARCHELRVEAEKIEAEARTLGAVL